MMKIFRSTGNVLHEAQISSRITRKRKRKHTHVPDDQRQRKRYRSAREVSYQMQKSGKVRKGPAYYAANFRDRYLSAKIEGSSPAIILLTFDFCRFPSCSNILH